MRSGSKFRARVRAGCAFLGAGGGLRGLALGRLRTAAAVVLPLMGILGLFGYCGNVSNPWYMGNPGDVGNPLCLLLACLVL